MAALMLKARDVGRKSKNAHRYYMINMSKRGRRSKEPVARFMAIAGIWRDGQGNHPPAFTTLTTEPGPDVAPRPHHTVRSVVRKPYGS